ncbi:unnamed protein product [Sphagnum balticum]
MAASGSGKGKQYAAGNYYSPPASSTSDADEQMQGTHESWLDLRASTGPSSTQQEAAAPTGGGGAFDVYDQRIKLTQALNSRTQDVELRPEVIADKRPKSSYAAHEDRSHPPFMQNPETHRNTSALHHTMGAAAASSPITIRKNTAAAAVPPLPPPPPPPKVPLQGGGRRKRPSRKVKTTVLEASPADFSSLVQRLTGARAETLPAAAGNNLYTRVSTEHLPRPRPHRTTTIGRSNIPVSAALTMSTSQLPEENYGLQIQYSTAQAVVAAAAMHSRSTTTAAWDPNLLYSNTTSTNYPSSSATHDYRDGINVFTNLPRFMSSTSTTSTAISALDHQQLRPSADDAADDELHQALAVDDPGPTNYNLQQNIMSPTQLWLQSELPRTQAPPPPPP